ncbi:hypothetical protein H4R18_004197 [Coemansia javaensis]|uniref:Chord-domain-containing protein n=1 Tax=Coemansia javaensis TaxID=2761396 RepID=A0A9W8H6C6_9FUNG|nr:hypothetical protein H4R18_004197 [Coemansia javaensis]
MAVTCTRNGCGKSFEAAANDPMACQYHPGKPEFHEGLKGWTCCKPRVHSFDEFLEIQGCMLGPHSAEPKHKDDPFKADLTKYDDVLPAPAPKAEAASRAAPKPEPAEPEPMETDPAGVAVAPGAKCKRNGCAAAYESEAASRGAEACQFHPGAAVFHEGTKGWSCCKPRTTDFDEFTRIAGCARGPHLFVGSQRTAQAQAQAQSDRPRRDFYQIANDVVVTIYARQVDRAASSVAFDADAIRVHLVYGGGRVYSDTIRLFGPTDPAAAAFEILPTKVEIKLAKATPGAWAGLEAAV